MPAHGRLLGSGKEAEVFEQDGAVLKLYRREGAKVSAFREAAHLAMVEALELPAPRVGTVGRFGERWGLTMSRAPGVPLAEAMLGDAADFDAALRVMVGLHRRIHDAPGTGFPAMTARLARNIAAAPQIGAPVRRRLLEALAALPVGDRLCHGDFHPWNILGTREEPVVVDWLDAASGAPAADVCRSYVLMRHGAPELAEAYLAAYAGVAGMVEAEIRCWVPVVAGARLAEGVPEEEAALLAMAEGV